MRRRVLAPTKVAAASRARHMLLAVSLATLLALALTLAAPVAAQEETTAQSQTVTNGKDATSKQEQSVQGSEQQAEEEAQEDEQAAGRATESLQRAEALIIEDGSDDDQAVDSIEVDATGCEVDKGAVVTVEDETNESASFTNAPEAGTGGGDEVEATIVAEPDQVVIEVADDSDLAPRFGARDANEDGSVTSSTGVTCGLDDDGNSEGGGENDQAGEEVDGAAEQSTSDEGTCAGAEAVEKLSGNGDQQSPRFSTTGDSFRVTSEVEATEESFFFSVTVNDENGDFVTSISQEDEGTNVSFVNADAGTYFLDISSLFADYTITVEDCVRGNITNNPGGNLPNTGGLSLLALAVLGIISAAAGLSVIRGGRR